ncbi:MAG: dihydrofolate reductase family protein [Dermatophilaceae bacterium]
MFLTDPTDDDLQTLYAVPASSEHAERPFVRANFILTVDGRIAGPDGTSSSINNPADKRVFDLLRSLADTVLVGAGTVRGEGYGRLEAPPAGRAPELVVVSNSGRMPGSVLDSPTHDGGVPRGRAVLATHASAPAQEGVERLVCGEDEVDAVRLLGALWDRGARSVLCEGGPSLLTTLLGAGLVDELALTTAPMIVGDVGEASLTTAPLDMPMQWRGGAVIDGTVFSLWRVSPDG